ncbi:MAG: DUF929 domain-containing protein [Thermoplasmata archaeon]|nr:DUF929 domain-containing protein [Thermoplasmata archaeon]
MNRLRAKGYDWKSIADDPKVGFTHSDDSGDPGRALKALYLTRKSRSTRSGKPGTPGESGEDSPTAAPRRWGGRLEVLGVALIIAGLVWVAVALAFPSVAVLIPALPPRVPDIFLVVIAGIAVLLVPLVLGLAPFADHWKKGLAAGLALAVVLAGGSGLLAIAAGIPNLSPDTTQGPGVGWEKAPNPNWESAGKPVVFFYGSEACPFCSASSWAIERAMASFGTWSGLSYASSNPADTYPNTPEVALSSSSLLSAYLSWDVKEGSDTSRISEPDVSLTEQAYLNAYDTGGIPFFVVGGTYIHVGTIVDPQALQGQTVTSVQQSLQTANPNDPVYATIEAQVVYLEAYFAKACQNAGLTPPSAVTGDSSVSAIMAQI